jgi:hypothetical protein
VSAEQEALREAIAHELVQIAEDGAAFTYNELADAVLAVLPQHAPAVLATLGTVREVSHPQGAVLPDRGDGLHWMECTDCGAEFAERDDGTLVAGPEMCTYLRVSLGAAAKEAAGDDFDWEAYFNQRDADRGHGVRPPGAAAKEDGHPLDWISKHGPGCACTPCVKAYGPPGAAAKESTDAS